MGWLSLEQDTCYYLPYEESWTEVSWLWKHEWADELPTLLQRTNIVRGWILDLEVSFVVFKSLDLMHFS